MSLGLPGNSRILQGHTLSVNLDSGQVAIFVCFIQWVPKQGGLATA